MTTNISECMNSILNEARNRPIVSVVEAFRKVLQRSFVEHRDDELACRSRLTVWFTSAARGDSTYIECKFTFVTNFVTNITFFVTIFI